MFYWRFSGAEAYMMGMKQLLLVEDSANLTTRHAKLQALKIEDMRPGVASHRLRSRWKNMENQ